MGWISILKTAACLVCGGALMGVLRGSAASGALAGLILLALFLAVALTVIAIDYAGRKPASPASAALRDQRESGAA